MAEWPDSVRSTGVSRFFAIYRAEKIFKSRILQEAQQRISMICGANCIMSQWSARAEVAEDCGATHQRWHSLVRLVRTLRTGITACFNALPVQDDIPGLTFEVSGMAQSKKIWKSLRSLRGEIRDSILGGGVRSGMEACVVLRSSGLEVDTTGCLAGFRRSIGPRQLLQFDKQTPLSRMVNKQGHSGRFPRSRRECPPLD